MPVILAFHTFHLRGQTKADIKKCVIKHPSLTSYISIYEYLKELNQALRLHIHNRKCQYFILLQLPRTRSNKLNICIF